jgi:beta-phosphoglucomutase family hydrolase
MQPYSAVIFDMDGVIVDSEPLHERAFQEIFSEIGYGDRHGVHFPDYYGKSDQAVWLDFIARHQPPQSLEDLSRLKQDRFLEMLRAERPVFPAIPGLLADLMRRTPLGLASGSSRSVINAVLNIGNLKSQFNATVSAQEVPRGKPAPDIFLRAAELLGVAPGECVVVEDATAGVAAALAAGMRVIAITNSLPPDRFPDATAVVRDYDALRRLLF